MENFAAAVSGFLLQYILTLWHFLLPQGQIFIENVCVASVYVFQWEEPL